jgi:type VI secretion system secreted protein VgrG
MMSPDAGGTDQITQNRGYVAIPEVGDQVMVNFRAQPSGQTIS